MSPHGNKFRTNMQFSPSLAQRIEIACKTRDLSVAALIRQAVIDWLDRFEEKARTSVTQVTGEAK